MPFAHGIRTGKGPPLPGWLERLGHAALFPAILMAGGLRPRGARIVTLPDARAAPAKRRLNVVTWNTHFACGPCLQDGCDESEAGVKGHLGRIASSLREWDADIVALQEVDRRARRTHYLDELRWLMREGGYGWAAWTSTWLAKWVPHPGLDPRGHIGNIWSGHAVLSKWPLTQPRRVALPQPEAFRPLINAFYMHQAILSADLEMDGTPMRILETHLDAFSGEARSAQLDLLLGMMKDAPPASLMLGDLNAVPPEAPARHGFPDEPWTDFSADGTIERLRAVDGWAEVAATEGGTPEWFTFPAEAPNRRLDYIFHGDGLRTCEAAAEDPRPAPSDHLPVRAVLELV